MSALLASGVGILSEKSKEAKDVVVSTAQTIGRSGFANTDPKVGTLEEVAEAGDPVAQKVVEDKKEERKNKLFRAGLLDILMGALAAFIAFRYNRNETRGWLKILTVVAAFFFWPFYCLYILIRSGALGKTQSIRGLSDVKGTFGDISGALKDTGAHLRETASKAQMGNVGLKDFAKGGYYY